MSEIRKIITENKMKFGLAKKFMRLQPTTHFLIFIHKHYIEYIQ